MNGNPHTQIDLESKGESEENLLRGFTKFGPRGVRVELQSSL